MSSPQPDTPNFLEHALTYLMEGKPVFPVCSPAFGQHSHYDREAKRETLCSSPGKVPLVPWRDYQSRLPSEAELGEWWSRRWPSANIGMATGTLSGTVVLDADGEDARKAAMAKRIPNTPSVWTGKAGGAHFHFKHPGREVRNFARRLPGLDFRGDGGYVLLPPSLHVSGRRYEWVERTVGVPPAQLPLWLVELLTDNVSDEREPGDYATFDLDAILRGVPEGSRDETLYRYACKLRDDNVPHAYADLLIRQAAHLCRPPFDESTAAEKVARAYRLYQPTPRLEVPPSAETPSDSDGDLFDTGEAAPAYTFMRLGELVLETEPVTEEILEGILYARRTTWAFSAPNVGKTLFLVAAGLHIAAGRPFCGRRVKQSVVALIEEDSPLSVLSEYAELLADIYGFDLEAIPFYVNREQGLRLTDAKGCAIAEAALDALPESPEVILYDACERLVPSDKFSTKELDPFGRFLLKQVQRSRTNIVIDHTRRPVNQSKKDREKEVKQKGPPDPQELLEELYGARAKQAISDVMIHFGGSLKGGQARLTFCKFRGELPSSIDIGFTGDEGFTIGVIRREARTPTEVAILGWLNHHTVDWYFAREILEGAGGRDKPIPERSGKRALSTMTKRGLLERDDTRADKNGALYRLAPAQAAVFD